MTLLQWVAAGVGALLVYGAFTFEGTYKGVFVYGRRKPDYPPNLAMRVILFIGGVLIVWGAVTGQIK